MLNRTPRVVLSIAISLSFAGLMSCAQSTSLSKDSNRIQSTVASESANLVSGESISLVNPELSCNQIREDEIERIRTDGQNAVSRQGPTLKITAFDGKIIRFTDKTFGEYIGYTFCKFVPEAPGYLIMTHRVDSYWLKLVSRSGSQADMFGPPLFSPNRQYVAASNWDVSNLVGNKIGLWRILRRPGSISFEKVWEMDLDKQWATSNSSVEKWGPGPVKWLNDTSFEFAKISLKHGSEPVSIGRMRVSLRGGQWQPVAMQSTATSPMTATSNSNAATDAQIMTEAPITPGNTSADARIIAEATGGELTGTSGKYYNKDCNHWVTYEAQLVDLNDDGQPEVFSYEREHCTFASKENRHAKIRLFIKNPSDQWRLAIDDYLSISYGILPGSNQGFPTLGLFSENDDNCMSVWKFDARSYVYSPEKIDCNFRRK